MPDTRHEVLITRPNPEAEATAARLATMRLTPIIAPLLTLRHYNLHPPATYDAIAITSANALPLPPVREGLDASPTNWNQTTSLLAVGNATAQKARLNGFTQVTSADSDATGLLRLIQTTIPTPATILLATGRNNGHQLATDLRQAGYTVHRRVTYAAIPVTRLPKPARDALHRNQLRAALFLSAATARTFARILPPHLHPALSHIDALAIGQPAAEALALLPWRRVRVSVAPTLEQVLALL